MSLRLKSRLPVALGSLNASVTRPDWTHRVRVARSMPSSSQASAEPMRSGVFVTVLFLRHEDYFRKSSCQRFMRGLVSRHDNQQPHTTGVRTVNALSEYSGEGTTAFFRALSEADDFVHARDERNLSQFRFQFLHTARWRLDTALSPLWPFVALSDCRHSRL
jgi:hypothetical protein